MAYGVKHIFENKIVNTKNINKKMYLINRNVRTV